MQNGTSLPCRRISATVGGCGVGVGEEVGPTVGVEVGTGRVGSTVADSGVADGIGVAAGDEAQAPRLKAINTNKNSSISH